MTTSRPGPARRAVLVGTLPLAALLLLGGMPAGARAAPLPGRSGGPLGLDGFFALSARLTGHDALDPDLGERLAIALEASGQGAALARLYDAVASAPAERDALAAAIAWADADEAARALLRGWYVGLVRGADGDDVLVGYEETLVAEVVGDFLELRSFCGGEPHFWVDPPALDDLPL